MGAAPPAPLSPTEREVLEALCRETFGSACRIDTGHVVLRRHDYLVLLVTLNDPGREVAIKLAGPAAPLDCPFERTAAILRLVRERTALPVPTPLAQDVSCRSSPWRYAIATRLPGIPWSVARQCWTVADRDNARAALGRAVAALHTIVFPACGEIGADGLVIDGRPYADALALRAARRIADERHRETFLRLLADRAALFADRREPCLSHEDLNPTNLLLSQDPQTGRWELSGLLDFDSTWAGDREADLARLALWDGMTGESFWAAYGLDRALTPGEAERRLIHQLLWCLEYAQPTPRHHADTARICAALGLSPIHFN